MMTEEGRRKTREYVRKLDEARRTKALELEPTVSLARGLDKAERDWTSRAVVHAGWHILRSRKDFERAIQMNDPPASDFAAIWNRLHQQYLASKKASKCT
jgi:hypothetical protein